MDNHSSILARVRAIRPTVQLRADPVPTPMGALWPERPRSVQAERGRISRAVLALARDGYRPLTVADADAAGAAEGLPEGRLPAFLRSLSWLSPVVPGSPMPTLFYLSPIAVRTAKIECASGRSEPPKPVRPPIVGGRFEDLSGQRFGRLVVVRYMGVRTFGDTDRGRGYAVWLCRCDCGLTAEHYQIRKRTCCSRKCPLNKSQPEVQRAS